MNDLDVMARTLYGEARNQGQEGIEAVACVIMNRVRAEKWFTGYIVIAGKKLPSVSETCLKRAQFSCWNHGDPNLDIIKSVTTNDKIFSNCMVVANKAINGLLEDFTNGATYYHTRNCQPEWAKGHIPCYECGAHLFYNDVK